MKPEDATSPLRRLYFLVQGALMEPGMKDALRPALAASIELIVREGMDEATTQEMRMIAEQLDQGSYFASLKVIRGLMKRLERSFPPAVEQSAKLEDVS